jgi:serine/threonine protein kinase
VLSADHPFIVSLEYAFQSANSLFLVMEFCRGGDLYEAMHAKQVGHRHFEEVRKRLVCAML